MMQRFVYSMAALCAMLLIAPLAWAMADFRAELLTIQQMWAQIKYQMPKTDRQQGFKTLLGKTETLHDSYPDSSEAILWSAVVLYNYAGEVRGMKALAMIKQAYRMLQQAEKMDPNAANGFIHTALGQLYYKVPGWPIAFGDEAKAEKYLHKGIERNPDGLDTNYFMGDYLLHKKQYCQAAIHLRRAVQAPARAQRMIADAGRKADALTLLRQAEKRFNQQHSGVHHGLLSLSQHGSCAELRAS